MTAMRTGTRSFRHSGWHRSPSSWAEGDPPHISPIAALSVVWADPDRTIPVAMNDHDGCYAVGALDDEPTMAGYASKKDAWEDGYDAGVVQGRHLTRAAIRTAFADAFMAHPTGRMLDMEVMAVLDAEAKP